MSRAARKNSRLTRCALAGLLAVLVPVGCSPESDDSRGPDVEGADQAAAPGEIPVVDESGLRQLLEEKRGTPLLLNLWAMWCGPCVAELPHLQAAAAAHAADGLEVVALNMELMAPGFTVESVQEDLPDFVAERQLDLPWVIYSEDDVGPLAEWFDVSIALPVTVVIRRDGSIVNTHQGFASEEEFLELAEQALGAPVDGR